MYPDKRKFVIHTLKYIDSRVPTNIFKYYKLLYRNDTRNLRSNSFLFQRKKHVKVWRARTSKTGEGSFSDLLTAQTFARLRKGSEFPGYDIRFIFILFSIFSSRLSAYFVVC